MFLILLTFSVNCFAQENSGIIRGKITDYSTGAPLQAEIRITRSSDSTSIINQQSDSSGLFVFDKLPFDSFTLSIKSASYKKKDIKLTLNSSNPEYNLDSIRLTPGNVTEEILVEKEKSLINFQGDKKVFNVDQTMLTKGGNALDVLKKVPMVEVDINDNVTLRGSQNVKILIDDKENRFVNLKQLSADAIEKVEIITNPSAKYEAEGVTGIINIVLKKNDRVGFNGDVNLGIGSKDKYNGGLNLSLKRNLLNIFGSTYLGIWNYSFKYNNNTHYTSPLSSLAGNGNGNGRSKYSSFNSGIEYEVFSKNFFGIEGSYSISRFNSTNSSLTNVMDSANTLTSSYTKNNVYEGNWKNYSLSLYYNGKLNDKGRELTGDVTLSGNGNKSISNILNQNYNSSGSPDNNPIKQLDTTDNNMRNINLQIDYSHPVNDEIKIETGYKGTFRLNDNDYVSDTLDYSTNTYIHNQGVSNHFKLTDYINAGYVVISGNVKKFGYKFGLRVENTHTKGDLLTGIQDFTKDYTDFFPSVNLTQKFGTANQVQLSYTRRITRPNIFKLNPFVVRNDARNKYFGNPLLNPEFTDSYELSLLFFTKVITVTPLFFFRSSHDIISGYSYLIDSNVTATTYRNAAGSKAYGMDLILNSGSLGWMNLTGTLSLYNTKFDKDVVSDYAAEEGFSWKANIRSSFSISNLFKLELYYNYTGKKYNSQSTGVPTQNLDVGISKDYLKGKGSVSLRVSDVFKTTEWGQDVRASGYTSSFRNNYDSRVVYLNLSYRFGNTDEYYQKKKKVKQNTNEGNDTNDEGVK